MAVATPIERVGGNRLGAFGSFLLFVVYFFFFFCAAVMLGVLPCACSQQRLTVLCCVASSVLPVVGFQRKAAENKEILKHIFKMTIVTRITKMLNIKHPIIQVCRLMCVESCSCRTVLCRMTPDIKFTQLHLLLIRLLRLSPKGGMHHVGFAQMAAAVSNAGGLGMITALTMPDAQALEAEIRKCRTMTSNPFGVNLTILPVFKDIDYKSYVDVVIREGIKVVETAGRPPSEFIDDLKAADIKIIHKCVTTRHAKSAVRMGADAISLDGFECAGHPGESDIGNYILQAMGQRELDVPFVCSGGVGNGAQVCTGAAERFEVHCTCNWRS